MGKAAQSFKAVFKREIEMFSSRYLYIFIVVGLPLFSLIYMATIFGNGQIENIPIGIVDNTNSPLTRKIIREVSAVPTFKITPKHYYLNEKQAREATQKMEIYGYLVIPPNFDSKLYNGQNPTLTYYYHYAVLSVGGEINGAFLNVLGNVSAGILQQTGRQAGLSAQQITALVLPTNVSSFPIYNPDLDFSIFISYPFFFIFLQIIILVFVVYSIGMEIKTGSITQLLKSAGGNIFIAILGKLSLYAIIFIIESVFANYVFFVVLKIPFACSLLPLILSGILLIIATMCIGVIFISVIPQLPIAISFASMFGALGATTSGVTFPVDSMYKIFETMCYLFPVRYFTHINHNLLYDNVGFMYTWPYFAALIAFIIPALLLLPRLNKIAKNKIKPIPAYYGIILIILGGTIGYGLLYNFMYKPNIVEKVPIALVDNSKSELSYKYTNYLNATQGISVLTNAPDFEQAKKLMESHKIRGIIFLPHNFSDKISNGEESVFLMYETTVSFLYYLTIQGSAISAMQQMNNQYREDIVRSLPKSAQIELSQAPSLSVSGIPLYNHNGGYGSFLLPIVFVVVIFQTLLMAMGAFCGDNIRFTHTYKNTFINILHTIAPFVAVYFALSFFLLGLLTGVFNLPNIGNPLIIYPFILLFIITTAMALMAFSFLFKDSESVMLMIPFFSIGLIFLSGMSFPLEQMPLFWKGFYYLFPSSPAVTGYIKLSTMGGSLNSITPQIITLFAQLTVYSIISVIVCKKNRNFGYSLKSNNIHK